MTKNYLNNRNYLCLLPYLLLFLCCCPDIQVRAQAPTISYPRPAQNLTRGYGKDLLTIKLLFNEACRSGTMRVRLGLPASVAYVPGSLKKVAGPAAMAITEGVMANLRTPVFNISGFSAVGDTLVFSVARQAGCGTLTIGKDSVYFVTDSCSNATEVSASLNAYNFAVPVLSIRVPPALSVVLGRTAERSFQATNSGVGVIDTLRFFVVYPSGAIVNSRSDKSITANGIDFTPAVIRGDTLFYKIAGTSIFGGDSLLDNGESVLITEPIRAIRCATTTYGAGWGQSGTLCELLSGTSYIDITNNSGIAKGTINIDGYVDKCTAFDLKLMFKVWGSGTDTTANMYNVSVYFGQWAYASAPFVINTGPYTLSNARVDSAGVHKPVGSGYGSRGQYGIYLANAFTTDPDGPGGLDDLDGDGYYDDIKNGDSINLRARFQLTCAAACGAGSYIAPIEMGYMNWTNVCGAGRASHPAGMGGAEIVKMAEQVALAPLGLPAYLPGGVRTRFRLNISGANSTFRDDTSTRYRVSVVLPPGVVVAASPNARYGTTAVGYTLSGDTLIFVSPGSKLDSCSIDLIPDCRSRGLKTMFYKVEKLRSATCSCRSGIGCGSFTLNIICSTCDTGVGNYFPVVQRTANSLGWTNDSMKTRRTAAELSAYDLARAIYLDTIDIYGGGKQYGSSDNLKLHFSLAKSSAGMSVLTPLRSVVTIIRAGAVVSSAVITTLDSLSSSTTTQVLRWDLNSALPSGGLLDGDSISVVSSYVVSINEGLPTTFTSFGRFWYLYNEGSTGAHYCNEFIPELYLSQVAFAVSEYASSGSGCSSFRTGDVYMGRRLLGTPYSKEYFPFAYTDSIVMDIPPGYSFDKSYLILNAFIPDILTSANAAAVTGGHYRWVNKGKWLITALSNMFPYWFQTDVTGACNSVSPSYVKITVYVHNFLYSGSGIRDSFVAYSAINYNKPALSLTDLSGAVVTPSTFHRRVIRLSNTAGVPAPYAWINIPDKAGFNVLRVTDSATRTVLTATPASGNKWYQLGAAGIAANTSKYYILEFEAAGCTTIPLAVQAGYDCAGYPAGPAATSCAISTVNLAMPAVLPGQVQVSVVRNPGGGSSIDLCSPDSIALVLNSAQAGRLSNPYVTMIPPAGMSILSPVRVEYPLGSGNYQEAIVTSSGGVYQYALKGHITIDTAGILGTAEASTAMGGKDRQARLVIPFTTSCAFASGTPCRLNVYASRPCGSPATGNGISISTTGLRITGAPTPSAAGIDIAIGVTDLRCGEKTKVALSTTPTGDASSIGDTVVYTLPAGMSYAGGFTKGAHCDSCVIVVSDTARTVKVRMTPAVESGTSMIYSFDIQPSGQVCGPVSISADYHRQITPLYCGATPCASSNVTIASNSSPDINILKPNPVITDLSTEAEAWRPGPTKWWMGRTQKAVLRYRNDGTMALPANADSVEFFYGTATTPFAIRPLNKALAIGATDTSTYWLELPKDSNYKGAFVTARIPVRTHKGTEQCICSASEFQLAGVPLPLNFLAQTATVNRCAVTLHWEYNADESNLSSFAIERGNGSNYEQVGTLLPAVKTYTEVLPHAGTWYCRIRADQPGKAAVYSAVMPVRTEQCDGPRVHIYPNPAATQVQVVLQGDMHQVRYVLSDALGKTVLSGSLESQTANSLDVSTLPAGIYLLRVLSDEVTTVETLQIRK